MTRTPLRAAAVAAALIAGLAGCSVATTDSGATASSSAPVRTVATTPAPTTPVPTSPSPAIPASTGPAVTTPTSAEPASGAAAPTGMVASGGSTGTVQIVPCGSGTIYAGHDGIRVRYTGTCSSGLDILSDDTDVVADTVTGALLISGSNNRVQITGTVERITIYGGGDNNVVTVSSVTGTVTDLGTGNRITTGS